MIHPYIPHSAMFYINAQRMFMVLLQSGTWPSLRLLNEPACPSFRDFAIAILSACGTLFLTPQELVPCPPANEACTSLSLPGPSLKAVSAPRVPDHRATCEAPTQYPSLSEMILVISLFSFPNLNGLHRRIFLSHPLLHLSYLEQGRLKRNFKVFNFYFLLKCS